MMTLRAPKHSWFARLAMPVLSMGLWAWGWAHAQSVAAPASAQAQLESIRQAIVGAAMARPTQVLNTAWIDQNGQLHESSHFQTDGEVRSIRMPSLFNEPVQTSLPTNIQVDLLPSAWRQTAKAPASCEPSARNLRQPLKIFTHISPGFEGPQAFFGHSLLEQAQTMWSEQVKTSSRWWPDVLQERAASTYDIALSAPASHAVAWAVRLTLSSQQPEVAAPEPWYQRLQKNLSGIEAPGTFWSWQLTMSMGTLTQGGSFEPLWAQTMPVQVSAQEQLASPQTWMAALADRLQPIVGGWAQALDKRWTCEPIQFQVSKGQAGDLLINAGHQSGLSAGDRMLLVAPQYIPKKILEQGALDHLRLAEVTRVGQNLTTIRQLAGPPASGNTRWIALPL
jgi:hypothetical protein